MFLDEPSQGQQMFSIFFPFVEKGQGHQNVIVGFCWS
jgi:hypothetical protein